MLQGNGMDKLLDNRKRIWSKIIENYLLIVYKLSCIECPVKVSVSEFSRSDWTIFSPISYGGGIPPWRKSEIKYKLAIFQWVNFRFSHSDQILCYFHAYDRNYGRCSVGNRKYHIKLHHMYVNGHNFNSTHANDFNGTAKIYYILTKQNCAKVRYSMTSNVILAGEDSWNV